MAVPVELPPRRPLHGHQRALGLSDAAQRRALLCDFIPGHKSSDGARATANNPIRSSSINHAVQHYAPCFVAILVDHGLAAGSACATVASNLL
jgi:hypothetical protein